MRILRRLFHRLFSWTTTNQDEATLQAEIEEHLALQTAENLRSGFSPEEARRQALLKFGNVETMKESFRDQKGLPLMETLEDKTFASPPLAMMRKIAPGFFKTMGTPVVAGRDLTWDDLYDGRHVSMISENLAREWWGSPGAALGKRIRENPKDPWREIVGVVANVYNDGLQAPPPKFAYWPALMDEYAWIGGLPVVVRAGMYAIRSDRAATESLLAEAREVVWSVNGRQPVFLVTTLKELYDQSLARTSFTLVLLAIAGGMSLVLDIVGIYGVIAYTVAQRTREIGIRMALGAQPQGISKLFVRHGLLLAGIGTVLGLGAAAALTRLMKSLLFGVTTLDATTYVTVSAVLIFAATLASYLPSRRATAIDPVEALRAE